MADVTWGRAIELAQKALADSDEVLAYEAIARLDQIKIGLSYVEDAKRYVDRITDRIDGSLLARNAVNRGEAS
jgi:hypothetical protein